MKNTNKEEFRLLIFESNQQHTDLLHEKFSLYPWLFHFVTASLLEFLEELEVNHYDLILVDMDSSSVDTMKLLRGLKKNRTSQVFILMTSNPSYKQIQMALKEGAADSFGKPLGDRDIDRILNFHRHRITETQGSRRVSDCITFKKVKLELPSNVHLLPDTANLVAEDIYTSGIISPGQLYNLNLAILECLTNALEHGNLGINYAEKTERIRTGDYLSSLEELAAQEPYRHRKIYITYKISVSQVFVHILDEGEGFDVRAYMQYLEQKEQEDYHGRGVFLAQNMVDRMRYNKKGNHVTLFIKRQSKR